MAWSWSGAGKGAGTGAAAGGMIGGPKGAAIGAIGGGIIGGFSGGAQEDADKQRQAAIQQAMADQERIRRDTAMQRQVDLDRTMSLYGPALQSLEHLYGIPMSAWGEALPQNRPRMPTETGFLPDGRPVTQTPMKLPFAGQLRDLSGIKSIQGLQQPSQLRPGIQSMPMGRTMPLPSAAPPPAQMAAPRAPLPGVGAWRRY